MSLVPLLVGLVAVVLVFQLLQGAWRPALPLVLLLGFLQDPLRKSLPGQPPLTVGLVLVAAVAWSCRCCRRPCRRWGNGCRFMSRCCCCKACMDSCALGSPCSA